MSNYRQSSVAGEVWTRANRVVIENPYGSNTSPSVTFAEEKIVSIGGETIARPDGGIVEAFMPDNYSEAFDLLNPETGDVVGSMTYQQVYVALHSLYMHCAAKRDAAAAGQVE